MSLRQRLARRQRPQLRFAAIVESCGFARFLLRRCESFQKPAKTLRTLRGDELGGMRMKSGERYDRPGSRRTRKLSWKPLRMWGQKPVKRAWRQGSREVLAFRNASSVLVFLPSST